jgi:hypothetical protein
MKIENLEKVSPGDRVYFSGRFYEVAEIKEFPHGPMIGIYDEYPSKHIDYLKPESVRPTAPCYACQNGCPVCSGYGILVV